MKNIFPKFRQYFEIAVMIPGFGVLIYFFIRLRMLLPKVESFTQPYYFKTQLISAIGTKNIPQPLSEILEDYELAYNILRPLIQITLGGLLIAMLIGIFVGVYTVKRPR